MAIPRHLDEATARLKQAAAGIDETRQKPLSLESVKEWLVALTEYAMASVDIHTFNNESVHEKLHELAGRIGAKGFPPTSPGSGHQHSVTKRKRQM